MREFAIKVKKKKPLESIEQSDKKRKSGKVNSGKDISKRDIQNFSKICNMLLLRDADKFRRQKYEAYRETKDPKSNDPNFYERMKMDEENRKAFKALLEEFQDQTKEAEDGYANLRIRDV